MPSKKKVTEVLRKDSLPSVGEAILTPTTEVNPTAKNEIRESCERNNISIDDYVQAIKRGLTAKKITLDKYGTEHEEDDTNAQLKAALMGLELEGYIKAKVTATGSQTYNTVVYQWKQ